MTATTTDARPRRAAPKAVLTVTDAAVEKMQEILAQRATPAKGLRLSTPQKGCSGLTYKVDYVDDVKPMDERVETPAGPLFIDPASILYLIGSEMDWEEGQFSEGFTFRNPNEKGRCGCGESFTV